MFFFWCVNFVLHNGFCPKIFFKKLCKQFPNNSLKINLADWRLMKIRLDPLTSLNNLFNACTKMKNNQHANHPITNFTLSSINTFAEFLHVVGAKENFRLVAFNKLLLYLGMCSCFISVHMFFFFLLPSFLDHLTPLLLYFFFFFKQHSSHLSFFFFPNYC